jgi:hypothetical protein
VNARLLRLLLLVAAVLGGGKAALAQDNPVAAFRQFNLIGLFAADCSQAAGRINMHSIYRVGPSGELTLTYDHGPGTVPTVYTILSARLIAPDLIAYREQNRDDQRILDIEVTKTGSGIRVWSSRRTTGEVLVTNGNFNDGVPSPFQQRCGD